MKTVSKKLLSLLLVVLLLAAAVPFQAFAAGTPYTVAITVRDHDTDAELGVQNLSVSTESPATKTNIDAKVADLMSGKTAQYPDGCTIVSYTVAAGSPLLTNWDVLPADVTAITVKVKTNTIPTPADDTITLTLNGNGGAIDGYGSSTTAELTLEKNAAGKYVTPTLPVASKSGYTFLGWFITDTDRLENGRELTSDTEATAKYELITKNIKVKGVKTTQSTQNAWLISEFNATPGQNLLTFLNTYAKSAVEDDTPVGYKLQKSGDAILWYNYNGSNPLSGQEQTTNIAQEVLVKYEPKTFTLYFQVDGGSVNPTSKTVTYDSKVGTLPIPTKSGKVFLGWFDGDGVQYTSETVYKVNGDTTLAARWQNEASVLLRIYLDPNTTTPDRIVDVTGKVNGGQIGKDIVETIVTKYYQGSNMKLVGLFSDATWESYKSGSLTTGSGNVTIQNDTTTTNVYVVVKNATNKPNSNNNSGNSSNNSTTSTTKPADPDNPKTGDSMMIYTASAVMVLAAAALVTVQVLRKKRTY